MKIDEIENIDAVVIGAGPAGLSCAKELLKHGKKVLIIFPHDNLMENIGGMANQWHSQCAVLGDIELQNPNMFMNWPIKYEEYFDYIKEMEEILEIHVKANNDSQKILAIPENKCSINKVKTIIGTNTKWSELFALELSNPNLIQFDGEVISILHEGKALGVILQNQNTLLFDPKIKIYLATGCAKNTQILKQSNFKDLADSKVFGKYLADHPMFENFELEGGHRRNFFELFKDVKKSGRKYKEKTKYEVVVNSKILGVFEIRHFYTKRSLDPSRKTLSPYELFKLITNRFTQKIFNQIIFKPLKSKLWIQIAQDLNPSSKFSVDKKDFYATWELNQVDLENYHGIISATSILLKKWGFILKEIKRVENLKELKESAIPAYHPSGTTRAHQSKEFGVVDSVGKFHGCDNLFLCGSSIFTTPGWANPTLTIMALSTRTARLSN